MDLNLFIGNLAALLTTLSFLPQAIKAIRTRDTKSLSLPTYIMFVSGVLLWFIYGMRSEQLPIILGNLITFVFASTILICKLVEKK